MKQYKDTSYGAIPLQVINGQWHIFLVQHKNGDHWGFPKGHPSFKESPKETAKRELYEETKLEISKFLSDTPLVENYHFYKEGKEIDKTVHYYLVEVKGEFSLQENEIKDGRWFSFKEAYIKITFDESKFILTKVQEIIRKFHSEEFL
ncbi:MAG: hypothetical protein COT84_01865 [Chlamydiae bacterium CG10_big_fil_rev_8_21_14_0_10_35_9]|nr:MAG: hypothetical protein COT84_01865 [Chlamydiae bacterium CG10_big_fil_rev_8_21_14_0_10_35_9]